MATVFDVAAYILERQGPMTAMKLQKLVYYCQAWSLVWDEKPLFESRIEAWAFGPVVPDLYELHRGCFNVNRVVIRGEPTLLNDNERDTIDHVLEFYGNKSSQWLSELTHFESPWLNARVGLKPGERGSVEITLDSMIEYYTSVQYGQSQ